MRRVLLLLVVVRRAHVVIHLTHGVYCCCPRSFQRVLAVLLALVYFVPVPMAFTATAYRFALLTSFCLFAFQVYATHGKPWGQVSACC